MAPAICFRVCIMLEEIEKVKNRIEQKLFHHGTALMLYDNLDNGAGVYVSSQEATARCLFCCTRQIIAGTYIPSVWLILTQGMQ